MKLQRCKLALLVALIPLLFLSGCQNDIDSISAGGTVTTDGNGNVIGGGGDVTVHLRAPKGLAK